MFQNCVKQLWRCCGGRKPPDFSGSQPDSITVADQDRIILSEDQFIRICENTGDGSITIEFADRSQGLLSYSIDSLDRSGDIPGGRIVGDNRGLCETLFGQ